MSRWNYGMTQDEIARYKNGELSQEGGANVKPPVACRCSSLRQTGQGTGCTCKQPQNTPPSQPILPMALPTRRECLCHSSGLISKPWPQCPGSQSCIVWSNNNVETLRSVLRFAKVR